MVNGQRGVQLVHVRLHAVLDMYVFAIYLLVLRINFVRF